MKKMLTAIIMITVCFLAVTAVAFQESAFKIRFGNELVAMPNSIFIQNDRLYASVRDVGEALHIPVHWDADTQEVQLDTYHKKVPVSAKTEYKDEGVIPDEETAYLVGKTILEKYVGHPLEYETEAFIFKLQTTYLPEENAWYVRHAPELKDGVSFTIRSGYDVIGIKLNKNTGEVMYINTDTDVVFQFH